MEKEITWRRESLRLSEKRFFGSKIYKEWFYITRIYSYSILRSAQVFLRALMNSRLSREELWRFSKVSVRIKFLRLLYCAAMRLNWRSKLVLVEGQNFKILAIWASFGKLVPNRRQYSINWSPIGINLPCWTKTFFCGTTTLNSFKTEGKMKSAKFLSAEESAKL